jgi:hypothetical protein
VNEQKKQRKQRKQYTFEEDTSIVAQAVINIVDTSIIDPHPLIIALLEGYAQRVRTLYPLPETPDGKKPGP